MSCFVANLSFNLLLKKNLIGEHLAKLQAKWLIASYAPLASDFCPQRCSTRQISKITCVWRTIKLTDSCCVDTQFHVSLLSTYQQISNCCRPVLTYWLTDLCHQWLTDCWSCRPFCCNIFFLWYSSCIQSIMRLFYMAGVSIILLVN